MSAVTVKFVNEKEGSKWWSIKDTNDKWFSFDKTKLSLAKGKTYEVETTATEKNGNTYYTIVAAKEKSMMGGGNDVASGDRWWMAFVSNTVAHAIAAAQITDPLQIKTWAAAAKQAALEIEKSSAPAREPGEDDDRPPFS